MKNDISDIKEILQEESQQVKSDKELYNNLVKYLYNIFDTEIRPDLLERGFLYFSYNSTRKEVCNDLAETQKEYNYYFMNYTKALKQVKSFFSEDIKRINIEIQAKKEIQNTLETQTRMQKTKREKKKHTIFGVNPVIAILLTPIILFFKVLDQTK